MSLMKRIRESLRVNRFPEFVAQFMQNRYGSTEIPSWISEALSSVGIVLSREAQASSSSEQVEEQSPRKKRLTDEE